MSVVYDWLFQNIVFRPGTAGAVPLAWESAERCSCYTDDTRQPDYNCDQCGGSGVRYAEPVEIVGLFRSQARWEHKRAQGELTLAEAELTVPADCQPGYVDMRVRDRYRVLAVAADVPRDMVFYPVAQARPFVFAGQLRAWRVQVQGAENEARQHPHP